MRVARDLSLPFERPAGFSGTEIKGFELENNETRHALRNLFFVYSTVHAALLIYDAFAPRAFLKADRAATRMEKISSLLGDGGDFWTALIANADPGDYAYHAAIYAVSGRYGIILFQILIGFVSVASTYYVGRGLGCSARVSYLSGLLLIFFPGSLWQPHTLVTEAFYNPVLALSTAAIFRFLIDQRRTATFYGALFLLSVAISLRVQLVAFPLVLVLFFLLKPELRRVRFILPIIPASLSLTVLSMIFLFALNGSPVAPASDHGLATNLYERAVRIARVAQFDLAPSDVEREQISIPDFIMYVERHPAAYLETLVSDGVNLAANPGAMVVLTTYLNLGSSPRNGTYWTQVRDRFGLSGAKSRLLGGDSPLLVTVLVVEILWLTCMTFAAVGVSPIFFARDHRSARIFLLIVVAYTLAVPFASGAVRWQHRSPIDFVLSLLIIVGASRCVGWCRAVDRPRLG